MEIKLSQYTELALAIEATHGSVELRNRERLAAGRFGIDDDGLQSGKVFIRGVATDLTALFSLGSLMFIPPKMQKEQELKSFLRIMVFGLAVNGAVLLLLTMTFVYTNLLLSLNCRWYKSGPVYFDSKVGSLAGCENACWIRRRPPRPRG